MNCPHTREQLPHLGYGGLAPNVSAAVEAHLAGCADCRHELEALQQVRQALDAVPPVTAAVDLPRLYRAAAEAQERRFRRWRRAAVAFAGLAAALVLFAILPSLECRFEAHQVTLRWGTPPVPPPQPAPLPHPIKSDGEATQLVSATAPDIEESLRKLTELVSLLADDSKNRRELEILRTQLNELREQMRQWRQSTDRDVAALYAIQFPEPKKGKQP
jgi:hypothetical protein